MISLTINGVMSIPVFLTRFLDDDEEMHNLTFLFAESLVNETLTNIESKSDIHTRYYLKIDPKYSDYVDRFVTRFKELSELDNRYNCKYEELYNVPKSIMNEYFEIRFVDNSLDRVIVVDYDKDKDYLTLESIDK
jgi:hypothetical protein